MKNKNKIILILFCLFLVLCTAGTAGVLIWKNAKEPVASESIYKDGDKVEAADEAELRKLLLQDVELVVTLTEDIEVEQPIVVNGKKTLSGNGSVSMALYVMPYQYLINVSEDASLILDGATVNGNGVANGIKVEKNANLTVSSGTVKWGNPYGIEVKGDATIKGGAVTDTVHTGVFVASSGNVQMEAGTINASGYCSTKIATGGYLCISGNAILQDCNNYHIVNSGTCDVMGGVVRDSNYTLVSNDGELNVNYQGNDGGMIEWYNAHGSGIYNGPNGVFNAKGLYVHDVGFAGLNSGQGVGEINITNCLFQNTGNCGLIIKSSTASLTDVEIKNPGKHGVYVNAAGIVTTIENLTVIEPAERGLHNSGGTVKAKNVTVTLPGTYGVSTGNSGDVAGSVTVENLTVTGAGSNPENSQPAVNSYKSSLTVIGGTIIDSNNAGARVTDGGELTLKNVKIENTESHGIFAVHDNSKVTIENVSVTNATKHGVYVSQAGAKADIKNLTVTNVGERGLFNVGGTVTAKNVTITNTGLYGVATGSYTNKENGKVTAGSVIIDKLTVIGANGDAAVNSYNSVLTITNATINDSAKTGARVTDAGSLSLTNVEITNTGNHGVFVSSGGKGTIKNVTVKNAGTHGVQVNKANSSADIDTLTVIDTAERGLFNVGGTVTAKNVSITNTGLYGVATGYFTDSDGKVTAGSMTIDKLTVTGSKGDAAVNSYGSALTITNGTIKDSAKVGARATDGGTLKLTDVEITKTGTGSEGVRVTSKGKATLKNVTVTKAGKHGVYVYGLDSKANIDTVTVIGPTERGIYNEGGTITAKNVTIDSAQAYAVSAYRYKDSDGNITKGSIKIEGLKVTNSKTSALHVNTSVLTVNNATISDTTANGALANSGGTLNLTDVTMDRVGSNAIHVDGTAGASKAYLTDVTVKDVGNYGVLAYGIDGYAKIEGLEVVKVDAEYSSKRGLCNNGATVEASNVDIDSASTYSVSSWPYQDDDGNVVSNGTMEITDLKVTNSLATAVHANNSTVTVNGATLTDFTKYGAVVYTGGILTLNDATINGTGEYGVYVTVNSIANINNLTITGGKLGIYNEGGTVTASHVSVSSTSTYGVQSVISGKTQGSVTVNKLSVTDAQGNAAVYSKNSVVTVIGGTLTNSKNHGALVNYGGTLTLENVTIDGTGNNGVNLDGNSGASKAYLTDVTVKDAGKYGVLAYGKDGYVEIDTLEVVKDDATYSSLRGLCNNGATVKASKVEIDSAKEYGVASWPYKKDGTIVSNGTMEIIELTVTNSLGTAVYADNSVVTVIGGTLTNSKEHGSLVENGGSLTLENVTIDGTGTNGVDVDGSAGASKAYLTNVTVKDAGNYGVLAHGKDGYAEIDTLKVVKADATYSSKRGLCNKGAIVKASKVEIDCAKDYSVSSWTDTDADGNVLKGTMTVDTLTVTNSLTTAVHANNSTVTVNGATLTDFTKYGAVVYTGGILTLNDATINGTGEYGVYVVGTGSTLNMNGTNSIANAKTAGAYVSANSIANLNNLTVTNTECGIYVDSKGEVNLSGISSITNAGVYGVYALGDNSKININTQEGATVATDYLTITTPGERGIHNEGGTIVAANVTVASPGTFGVSTINADSTSGSVTVKNLTVTDADSTESGSPSLNASKSVLTVETATIEGGYNAGARVQNDGTLNLTGVTIKNAGNYGVYVTGSGSVANISGLTINTVNQNDGIRVINGATLNVSGVSSISGIPSDKYGIYVLVNSKAYINGELQSIEQTTKYVALDETSNKLTITGGQRGIYTTGGTVYAANVTVNNPTTYGVSAYKDSSGTRGTMNIYNLTVNGSPSAVHASYADITIDGATLNNTANYGIFASTSGTISVSNATINTAKSGVRSAGGTVIVGEQVSCINCTSKSSTANGGTITNVDSIR